MPANYYELISICFYLTLKTGKLPSMYDVADEINASYSAVVKRVHKMVKNGYLAPYKKYDVRGWFHLTAAGAEAYIQCLSGDRPIFADLSAGSLSTSRHARAPDARYKIIKRKEYNAQIERLKSDGPFGATI